MILTLTSESWSQGKLYDFASTQLAQTIAQIDGVGDVDVGGSSLPAVRVGLNPQALFNRVSLDEAAKRSTAPTYADRKAQLKIASTAGKSRPTTN